MAQTDHDSREAARMIDFATRWMPYGGGPAEDIVVGFGISPAQFFTRLQELLQGPNRPIELDRVATGALLQICKRRLWLGE